MSLNSLPPLVFKSFIGFDELFDEISRINHNKNSNYPAFDVIKTDEKNYEINLAVAGFNENEIEIVSMQNILSITGKKNQNNVQNFNSHNVTYADVDLSNLNNIDLTSSVTLPNNDDKKNIGGVVKDL